MTIAAIKPRQTSDHRLDGGAGEDHQLGDIEVTRLGDGIELLTGAGVTNLSFPNLATAIKALVETVQSSEHARLKMARIVDAIDRQQLYREAGVEDMKSFFPILLQQTAAVGWKSETSIKRYLAFYRLYILQLQLNPEAAIRAVSHLHNLYKLAHIDRKTGELSNPDKAGKLEPEQFEDVARLVIWLVSAPSKEQVLSGVSAEELLPLLEDAGLGSAARTYKELVGTDVELPQRGWQLADTQAIIDAVTATDEEDEDEGAKVEQVFVGYETFDGGIHVQRIEWRGESSTVLETIEVEKTYPTAMFKKLKGRAKAEIQGKDGEQN